MPAGRFYVGGLTLAPGMELELPPDVAHRARDVLRLAPGQSLCLLDGAGGVYSAQLLEVSRNHLTAQLGERLSEEEGSRPQVPVVLCQGMLKAARYEIALEKCTELGVAEFVPLLSLRAVAATEEAGASKQKRWARIVAEAMEQCGGTYLPELTAPQTLQQALTALPSGGIALIAWEEERAISLYGALRAALAGRVAAEIHEVRIFIGPEGGFSAEEIAVARRYAATPVTLGQRILRAETAAIAAVTLVMEVLRDA
jgi:16S rRNA (uracil1498-N3)-methyltransferase